MLSVIILYVTYKPFVQSVIMLSVVMLCVVMLSIVMLSVKTPSTTAQCHKTFPQ